MVAQFMTTDAIEYNLCPILCLPISFKPGQRFDKAHSSLFVLCEFIRNHFTLKTVKARSKITNAIKTNSCTSLFDDCTVGNVCAGLTVDLDKDNGINFTQSRNE